MINSIAIACIDKLNLKSSYMYLHILLTKQF